ncbi:FHA domain-containing protein [Microbacterium sp. SSW1-59]|uniref:FHA domain-containing protein n=1 Tax=Microbacterium xanthum TaxID=3079794 RepID=UPI002AD4C109|nr:FHA domain-containing protein [Microbacterium sp. SSW1-59]MDZ8202753.1 FHA domain-containing protein [Microbacterium sp. SSW1-59]
MYRVPEWPRLTATVTHDGTGALTINGVSRACEAESVAALRTGMIARAVEIGTQLRRPIRLDVTEEGRTHALAVRPEGYVQLIGADGTIPAPDGLSIDEGRCRVCRRLQPVTSTACVQCSVDEPLRVEVAPPDEPNRIAPAPAASVTRPSPVGLNEVEQTRISRRAATPAAPVLHLAFNTQRSIDAGPHVVIGRNPESVDGREALTVVTPDRMLSRTHATIDVDETGRIVVTDLHSANGIELQSTPPQWLTPGERTVIPDGATILLGDVYCTVTRA